MSALKDKRFHAFLFALCILTVAVFAHTPTRLPENKNGLPINAKTTEHDIDTDCGATGSGSGKAQKAQNQQKNDFKEYAKPVPISVKDFDTLEAATNAAIACAGTHPPQGCTRKLAMAKEGQETLPSDRTQLQHIAKTANGDIVGEGTVVVIEAQVLDSHYSNTKYNYYGYNTKKKAYEFGNGESVNCKGQPKSSQIDWNDLHIVLVEPGETSECRSVTAEISPHHRPEAWMHFHDMKATPHSKDPKTHKLLNVNDEVEGVDFSKIEMVRIAGPLFYDAAHTACKFKGSKLISSASPARRSIWEIHPVYSLDVKVNGEWMPFENWVNAHH